MDPVAQWVLVAAGATTAWLIYYAQIYLPGKLNRRLRQSARAFSTAIELRFPSRSGMTPRVVALAIAVGRRLGLSRAELQELELAASLRDVGLSAIPYGLVNRKPEREWTRADRLTYARHAEVSSAMLELVPSLAGLSTAVRWHHARFDGRDPYDSASPSGEHLPLISRILKACEDHVWIEKTKGDFYAREALRAGKGTDYCPVVVDALTAVLRSPRGESGRDA